LDQEQGLSHALIAFRLKTRVTRNARSDIRPKRPSYFCKNHAIEKEAWSLFRKRRRARAGAIELVFERGCGAVSDSDPSLHEAAIEIHPAESNR